MRASREIYFALKSIERHKGLTKDLTMEMVDDLISKGLAEPHTKVILATNTYTLIITWRGQAVLDDRPIE